ncbi:DDB1- and CUL4-associated factor 6 isoform X1 [Frankliniella occidentalis]|uniref:DDB1- and CUL4-associated factor 6 isoform X1 n=1 Tax=Frankliniella occidentalis TaxID=133901 RepID=A0A6J1STS2_FRAOC|nr:DDB1- and CUL4-associated factor 6 isoform X1 [Frankliniella occidentalis]
MKRSKICEKSLFHAAYNLPYDDTSRSKIYRSSKGDLSILQRMGLIKNIAVHSGCVNSISWNETGEYLLSGSDDQHLIISDAFTHKIVEDFKTSHRANIFSAKFLPCIRDTRIVSCSGDGILLFTDLMSIEPVYKPFNCHCGTAYEVATVPLDPHSFLSCGEDGTVRWYDLRIKDSCNKANCQEDVMIQCQRAVTAMSVNMTAPFELAIGCSDSTVRLFDRRMLGTKSTGMTTKQADPLCAFTVPSFKRAYRITSLCFAPEGEEILVSYSSDDLYLFSLRGKENTQLKTSAALCKKGKLKLSSSAPTPVRRLRLRGDWSDTGPDARPEREAGGRGDIAQARPTLHTPLMQHLTNVISRLLNDPATRAALTSGVDEAGSPESSQGTEHASVSQDPPDAVRNDEGDVGEVSDDQRLASPRNNLGPQVFEQPLQEYELFEAPGTSYDPFTSANLSQNISALSEEDNALADCYERPENFCDSPSPATSQPQTEYKIAPLRDPEHQKESNESEPSSSIVQHTEPQPIVCPDILSTVSSNGREPTDIFDEIETSNAEANTANRLEQAPTSERVEAGSEIESETSSVVNQQTDHQIPETTTMYAEAGIHEHDLDTLQSELVDLRDCYIESRHGVEPAVSLSYSHLSTNTSVISLRPDNEAEVTGADESEILTPSSSPLSPVVSQQSLVLDEDQQLRPEPVPGPSAQNLGSSSDSMSDQGSLFSDYDSEEDEEDLRRELRSRIAPPGLGNLSNSQEVPFPEIKQQYTGHRNARTMIKEATFWGTDYVMSGSDCGHVFVWDRSSAKLVMLLQADQHVVNCLQPHPTEPLLATSGIDHDIKLWAPVGEGCSFDQDLADEIVKRNALMLEETRDTITVPASFMIRMVACLNQIRRGGRSRSRRRTQGSQDD